jgi:hypothetical protein
MLWFKSRYVILLEEEISRLRKSLDAQRAYSDQLVERLLTRAGVPMVPPMVEPTKEALHTMLSSSGGGIFDDVDEKLEKVPEDNRQEKYDPLYD